MLINSVTVYRKILPRSLLGFTWPLCKEYLHEGSGRKGVVVLHRGNTEFGSDGSSSSSKQSAQAVGTESESSLCIVRRRAANSMSISKHLTEMTMIKVTNQPR